MDMGREVSDHVRSPAPSKHRGKNLGGNLYVEQ
jgi:hypothetical protein